MVLVRWAGHVHAYHLLDKDKPHHLTAHSAAPFFTFPVSPSSSSSHNTVPTATPSQHILTSIGLYPPIHLRLTTLWPPPPSIHYYCLVGSRSTSDNPLPKSYLTFLISNWDQNQPKVPLSEEPAFFCFSLVHIASFFSSPCIVYFAFPSRAYNIKMKLASWTLSLLHRRLSRRP